MINQTTLLSRHGKRRRRGERGQSMVEFAAVMTIFLVLVFGIAEFGFVILNSVRLTNAANDAARVGALKGGTDAQAITAANTATSSLISCPTQTPQTDRSGTPTQLTMTVLCDYHPVTPLGSFLTTLNLNVTLKGSAVMRVEQ